MRLANRMAMQRRLITPPWSVKIDVARSISPRRRLADEKGVGPALLSFTWVKASRWKIITRNLTNAGGGSVRLPV